LGLTWTEIGVGAKPARASARLALFRVGDKMRNVINENLAANRKPAIDFCRGPLLAHRIASAAAPTRFAASRFSAARSILLVVDNGNWYTEPDEARVLIGRAHSRAQSV